MDKYRSSFTPDSPPRRKKSIITSLFLSIIPGISGFGLLIASVAIQEWLQNISSNEDNLLITLFGLFSVCLVSDGTSTCMSREEYAVSGFPIDPLEQATRSLVIIAIILSIPGILSAIYLGLRRKRREYGSIASGSIFLLAALCAISGMGCYSALLANKIAQAGDNLTTFNVVQPGISFLIGWFGTFCVLIASIFAYVTHVVV